MGVLDWFRKTKLMQKYGSWKELGSYTSQFTSFGTDVYKSGIVRSCIRPLAEHTSKANAKCKDKMLERVINVNPNMYMSGKDFLAKVRTRLELTNTAFIYIIRNDRNKVTGLYPVPYTRLEAIEYKNGLFIKFYFDNSAAEPIVVPWNDLAVLRKDYNKYDISGDDNNAILDILEVVNTTNQGIANAVKSTSNLRGIIKSTKAMLSEADVSKMKDRFVKEYLGLENEGGIAALDSTMEFIPVTLNPTITSWEQVKEFREDIYRYFGISEAIVTSNYTESQMEAFYTARIEPFLVALGLELSRKIYTDREIGFENYIVYESNRVQYASTQTKLALVAMVDRGALTPNEWRAAFNLAPVDGGDVPIRRLDTAEVEEKHSEDKEGEDDGEENDAEN